MTHATSRLTIDMPSSEHKRLKMVASMMKTSMKELVLMSVENFMERKFNKKTEKALRDAEKGKNLKKFATLKEFYEDLGV